MTGREEENHVTSENVKKKQNVLLVNSFKKKKMQATICKKQNVLELNS